VGQSGGRARRAISGQTIFTGQHYGKRGKENQTDSFLPLLFIGKSMNRQDYTDNLLAHYEHPQYYGQLPHADVVKKCANSACGDEITIYLKVSAHKTAQAIQFEGQGCTISQGATSILMEMMQGKTLAEIDALDYNDLLDRLGRELVLARINCATLGLTTLKQAVRKYYKEAT
jgi:nitrogen fixation NifU-like protein